MSFIPIADVILELKKTGTRQGFDLQDQEPNGLKLERGSNDSDAPRLVQFGSPSVPTCCVCNGTKMIKMVVRVSVTDRDSGDDSSGVRRVCLKPLLPNGGISIEQFGFRQWELTTAERKSTITGSATHDFSGCVPCTSFEGVLGVTTRTARFRTWTEDDEGNISIQFISITVGEEQFANCCE